MNEIEEFVEIFINYEKGYFFITGRDKNDCLWMVTEWKGEE